MTALPSACVIGAGSSGIAALKVLAERGIPVECFEKSDRVGGNWTFETGVSHAARDPDGVWSVELDTGETRRYDALLVANGHHWDPLWAEPPYSGEFAGVQMRSHYFVDAADFRDKSVLVVGMGNSALDIAVEASFVAGKTFVSSRRGAHVLPKYALGRPIDQIAASPLAPLVPFGVRHALFRAIYRVVVGRVERYGLPSLTTGCSNRIRRCRPISSGGSRRARSLTSRPLPRWREIGCGSSTAASRRST